MIISLVPIVPDGNTYGSPNYHKPLHIDHCRHTVPGGQIAHPHRVAG
jgi:arginyl-tRNA synthetase